MLIMLRKTCFTFYRQHSRTEWKLMAHISLRLITIACGYEVFTSTRYSYVHVKVTDTFLRPSLFMTPFVIESMRLRAPSRRPAANNFQTSN